MRLNRLNLSIATVAMLGQWVPSPQQFPAVTVTLGQIASVTEGNSGTTAASVLITLNRNGSTATHTFDWALGPTGTNPVDATDFGGTYPAGTVSFAPGETSKTVQWLIAGDTTIETDETYLFTLSQNGIAWATAVGAILNDDTLAAPGPAASVAAIEGVFQNGLIVRPPTTGGTPTVLRIRRSATAGGAKTVIQTIAFNAGQIVYRWLHDSLTNDAAQYYDFVFENGGGSWTSAEVTATPSKIGFPKPHQMAAWYNPADITGFANAAQINTNWLCRITGIAAVPTGSQKPTFLASGQGGLPAVKTNGANLFSIGAHALMDAAATSSGINESRGITVLAVGRNSTSSEFNAGHMFGGETNGKNAATVLWTQNTRGALVTPGLSNLWREANIGTAWGTAGMSCSQNAGSSAPTQNPMIAIMDGVIINRMTVPQSAFIAGTWTIGARSASSYTTNMEIYGCHAWATELSAADHLQYAYRQRVKAGVAHPYAGATYYPIISGNSIVQTVGIETTQNASSTGGSQLAYAAQLMAMAGKRPGAWAMVARHGFTFPGLRAYVQQDVIDIIRAPWFQEAGLIPHIHMHEGYNGGYGVGVFNDMALYVQDIKAGIADLPIASQAVFTAFTAPDTEATRTGGPSEAARQALNNKMIQDGTIDHTVLHAVVDLTLDTNPVGPASGAGNYQGMAIYNHWNQAPQDYAGVTGQASKDKVHPSAGESGYEAGGTGSIARTAYCILGPGAGNVPAPYGKGTSKTDGWNFLN
ncbi:hypothetical protein [Sphingomonas azotifigens]|uniref:hypothetical protein n=1 Tax=Sphingomonas azotifigens TaxID=330920 RepID=UPI000A012252|nr:hypothetical protein [Sphingomonas azotifigens]